MTSSGIEPAILLLVEQYLNKPRHLVKVKVKLALEKATKAQRGSRVIALLFP